MKNKKKDSEYKEDLKRKVEDIKDSKFYLLEFLIEEEFRFLKDDLKTDIEEYGFDEKYIHTLISLIDNLHNNISLSLDENFKKEL